MRDANLVRVLQRQARGAIGLVPRDAVAARPEAVRPRLAVLAAEGKTAAVADAISERDLEVLGEVAAESPVSTGASGLGLGLARALQAGIPARERANGAAL